MLIEDKKNWVMVFICSYSNEQGRALLTKILWKRKVPGKFERKTKLRIKMEYRVRVAATR